MYNNLNITKSVVYTYRGYHGQRFTDGVERLFIKKGGNRFTKSMNTLYTKRLQNLIVAMSFCSSRTSSWDIGIVGDFSQGKVIHFSTVGTGSFEPMQ